MTTSPTSDASLDDLLHGAEEAAAALAASEDDEQLNETLWAWIHPLRALGGPDALRAAAAWAASPQAHLRALAADVLGQLNPAHESLDFADACRAVVIPLLADSDPTVLECALVALGHLDREERPWDPAPIVPLIHHAEDDVRLACAHALGNGPADRSPAALEGLMTLTEDPNDDVRDWAVFALGVQCDVDAPALREALARRLDDPSEEVRAEAIHGLARRKDERARTAIAAALASGEVTTPVLEAIVEWPDPGYVDALQGFAEGEAEDSPAVEALRSCEDMERTD